jgi:hypothetical protein
VKKLWQFEAQIEETRHRVAKIDECCAAIGRDPAGLHRSYLMSDPTARWSGGIIKYYDSAEMFTHMVQQVIGFGMADVALYYPMLERQVPMFEQIAGNVLPRLKAT